MALIYSLVALASTVLGVAIGLLVGLSSSPVASIVLPLLFGLIGGAGGLFLARLDGNLYDHRPKVTLIAVQVGCLSLGTIGGVWFGAGERSWVESWSIVTSAADRRFPPSDASSDEAVDWILLDARLYTLGLTAEQRRFILGEMASNTQGVSQTEVDEIAKEALQSLMTAAPAPGMVEYHGEWRDTIRALEGVQGADIDTIVAVVSDEKISLLTDDEDDRAHLASNPSSKKAHAEFVRAVTRLRTAARSPLIRAHSRIEEFLSDDTSSLANSLRTGGRNIASVEQAEDRDPG